MLSYIFSVLGVGKQYKIVNIEGHVLAKNLFKYEATQLAENLGASQGWCKLVHQPQKRKRGILF